MKRYIGCLALLGLLAIPDWASAHYVRQWFAARTCHPMPPVCYSPPVVYVPVYVAQPSAQPRVIPQAMVERDSTVISKPPVRTKPTIEPVRPVTAAIPEVNVPTPMPMPMKDPSIVSIPPVLPLPPKADANPLNLPDVPLKLPDVPKNAIPTPAPPPDSGSLIPPMFPKLPTPGNDALPPLVLPPETNGSTSKSSPLSDRDESKVQVLAAEGKPAIGPTRTVGFFNRTDRDIDLVIEGRSVTLPKRTYINAELATTFRWKQRGEETRTESVPEGAAGLDVVFRE